MRTFLSVFLIFSVWAGLAFSPKATASEKDVMDARQFTEFMKSFRDKMRVYSDGNGHYMIFAESFSGDFSDPNRKYLGDNVFWGDGKTFYQVKQTGFGGNPIGDEPGIKFHMGLEDPRYGGFDHTLNIFDFEDPRKEFEKSKAKDATDILFKGGKFVLRCGTNLVDYSPVKPETATKIRVDSRFIPLPEVRQPEYLIKVKGTGEYVYITASKYNYSYESFKMYMGQPGQLKEVKIKNVERYRDGGSTLIETEKGLVYVPFPRGGGVRGLGPDPFFQPADSDKKEPIERMKHWEMFSDRNKVESEKILGKDLVADLKGKGLHTPCDPFSEGGEPAKGNKDH